MNQLNKAKTLKTLTIERYSDNFKATAPQKRFIKQGFALTRFWKGAACTER